MLWTSPCTPSGELCLRPQFPSYFEALEWTLVVADPFSAADCLSSYNMGRKKGRIELPETDPTPTSLPSPDIAGDDASSIHSKHALKVLKPNSETNSTSPLSSDVTMPSSDAYSSTRTTAASDDDVARYRKMRNKTLVNAAIQFAILLVVCTALLAGTLYFVLPPIDEYV